MTMILFFMKNIVGSALELLTAKELFSLDKYQLKIWIENTVIAIQHIGNRKKVLLKHFSPCNQTNYFAYSCNFTIHTSYKHGMIGNVNFINKRFI